MTYAYCRVSTERQSLGRQRDNIIKAGYADARFFMDKWTGATMERPEWQRLYKMVKSGDTIIFDSVSRMSRDAEEGAAVYMELYDRGVNLVFLNEPHCNTDVFRASAEQSIPTTGDEIADIYIEATTRVLMILAKRQIRIAFEQAEKERLDISRRVSDGMASKKKDAAENGVTLRYGHPVGSTYETRKAREAKAKIRKYSKDFDGSMSDTDVIAAIGISRNSYYKYKKELKDETAA